MKDLLLLFVYFDWIKAQFFFSADGSPFESKSCLLQPQWTHQSVHQNIYSIGLSFFTQIRLMACIGKRKGSSSTCTLIGHLPVRNFHYELKKSLLFYFIFLESTQTRYRNSPKSWSIPCSSLNAHKYRSESKNSNLMFSFSDIFSSSQVSKAFQTKDLPVKS